MLEEKEYRLMGAAFEVYNQLGYGLADTSLNGLALAGQGGEH